MNMSKEESIKRGGLIFGIICVILGACFLFDEIDYLIFGMSVWKLWPAILGIIVFVLVMTSEEFIGMGLVVCVFCGLIQERYFVGKDVNWVIIISGYFLISGIVRIVSYIIDKCALKREKILKNEVRDGYRR